jgi:hypothetical protein
MTRQYKHNPYTQKLKRREKDEAAALLAHYKANKTCDLEGLKKLDSQQLSGLLKEWNVKGRANATRAEQKINLLLESVGKRPAQPAAPSTSSRPVPVGAPHEGQQMQGFTENAPAWVSQANNYPPAVGGPLERQQVPEFKVNIPWDEDIFTEAINQHIWESCNPSNFNSPDIP